jgi:hypothetical protein
LEKVLYNLPLAVTGAVSVSVGDKVESQVTRVVRLSSAHQIDTRDVNQLVILVVLGVVLEGQKDTSAAPAELVSCIKLVTALGVVIGARVT